jgi:hypothetical protein
LASRLPLIVEVPVPVTRLSAMEDASGCWKVTLPPAPMEKSCQLMIALLLFCTTNVLAKLEVLIEAEPAATVPPDGRTGPACAVAEPNAIADSVASILRKYRGVAFFI